jgi:hypothetical protein
LFASPYQAILNLQETQMTEETIYSDNSVNITTTRVIISGTTYALRNITSVKMGMTSANPGCAIILLVLGVLVLLGALSSLASNFNSGMMMLFWAAGIIAGGVLWLRSCKPSYHVAIASASGEARALISKDKHYIEKIVASVNDAIVRYQ